ncbi:PQQ-dependent sugar dehydrogenase [Flavobacterium zepuense]|uniref:PQQ-dependent sugar dehydrogenase n=1 Tax=Flavobacterium zepuense TaxID=2593302 RepID=A0A552V649_9FLAO|nr:PQQ-dependent sugar dehydrogenase [Flavobacterium zepuense]TRW25950.1 PQQ-dependent sugar dehydrogenase [Flavobacterium zepuense]
MSKYLVMSVVACSALTLSFAFKSNNNGYGPVKATNYVTSAATPAENYANYCSGCHGEKMDAFTDRQWKHGNNLNDLIKAIKNGYANEGMPAFGQTFTDTEIKELSEYILKGIKNVEAYNFDAEPVTSTFTSEKLTVKLDTIATGLDVPWGIGFLPDGRILVTERAGRLYAIKNKKKQEISGVPEVLNQGQGGLLDVLVHPDFANNSFIYFSYSKPKKTSEGTLATTAVMRAKLVGNKLTDSKIIFEALPYAPTRHHYGSRMVFDKDGYIFLSVGERGNEKQNPQSLENNQLGKIHRIKDDGSIPADNPFKDKAGKPTTLYCYGNRNPQGLAINPFTGALWENEHGPRGGDEINIIQPGKNYGWPLTSYGINYDGKTITDKTTAPGITNPELYWIPSIAPSGMAFIIGDVYKPWKGAVLVGSMRFKYLNLCYLDGNKIVKEEKLLKNIGRLRDVRVGPDGFIYVAVEKPAAAVYRLVPVE